MRRSVDGGGGVAPFLKKTYEMVDESSNESMVSWSQLNNSFVVWNVSDFATHLLPKFFKHSNFSSFVRQLNTYGFRKIDPDRWEFANEGFLRGQKHLLKSISRRKPVQAHTHQEQPAIQDPSSKACVELGNFGLEEEVERLKRDKNILVHELVRLKKQQQSTDNQFQTVGQRVQVMEQRQQQMMSFLAKEMQSPGFLAQFVQQQNEGNRHITEIGKKRRLPNHSEENMEVESVNGAIPDGRIVKYQPLINEAAKSMLEQILKLNGPLPNQSLKDPNSFLIDRVPDAYHEVDSRSCSIQPSAVTAAGPDIHFPGGVDLVKESQTPQIRLHDSQSDVDFDDTLLPGSNDTFWEQFFHASPLSEVTEEVVDSTTSEDDIVSECQSGQHEEWKNHHHVKHLTEQMGLLTAETEIV